GSKPETVESELLQLLWDVNEQAIEDGMMTDEQGLVGQVAKADEFLKVIIAVKERGRPVEVVARAREDTWNTRPPLTVTLELSSRGLARGWRPPPADPTPGGLAPPGPGD